MIDMNDTLSLIAAVEQIKKPASFLTELFFPTTETSPTSTVIAEWRERGREKLAPYAIDDSKGVNVSRVGSHFRALKPPLVAPRRILTQEDITRRSFGEMPVFSTMSAEERAAKIQADDLVDLLGMIQNRKEQMASEVLTTGKIEVKAYADDGRLQKVDEVDFNWCGAVSVQPWDSSDATIFSDLQAMSEDIQEYCSEVPTVLVVGRNVPGYLRKNKEIYDWLMIPNRETATLASLQPTYESPQVQYIGRINALNLEVYCYSATYTGDDGQLKSFVGENDVIMGMPGLGRQLHAAITLIDDGGTKFQTYATAAVPSYSVSKDDNTIALTVRSRFLLVPDISTGWRYARVKQ